MQEAVAKAATTIEVATKIAADAAKALSNRCNEDSSSGMSSGKGS